MVNFYLTNFRKLNEYIEQKPFPLPRIGEAIQKLENFKSATALDLSQEFYSIPINEDSQKLYTTVLPWGKYAYKRLPIGIACAPNIFQSILMELLGDLEHVLVYIEIDSSYRPFESSVPKHAVATDDLLEAHARRVAPNNQICFRVW